MNTDQLGRILDETSDERILTAIDEFNREMGRRGQEGFQRILDILDADEQEYLASLEREKREP
jgi:hypothetical protein